MVSRFPLYSKILACFFLNLIVLLIVLEVLLSVRFQFDFDKMISSGSYKRINTAKNLVTGELNSRAKEDWNGILERFGNAYNLQPFLTDRSGTLIAGDRSIPFPPEVIEWIKEFDPSHPPSPTPATSPMPSSSDPKNPSNGNIKFKSFLSRSMIHTEEPSRYWLMIPTRVNDRAESKSFKAILLLRSDSMNIGGLVLDYKPWIIFGIGTVFFSALFWLPFVRGVTQSILQMTKITQKISEGSFNARVDIKRQDELALLGQSINLMAERLDGLVKGQKRFQGDIAHELCSPLARLQMAYGILEQNALESQKSSLQIMGNNLRQMSDLVGELLSFSKASFGESYLQIKKVNLEEMIELAAEQESISLENMKIEIPVAIEFETDPSLFIRAISNLFRNTVKHAGAEASITVQGIRTKEGVEISIADNGPGVPDVELPRIFDPFYRLDLSRDRKTGGTGLGLTIVKSCIESCGGTILAKKAQPHGLEIYIRFPQRP